MKTKIEYFNKKGRRGIFNNIFLRWLNVFNYFKRYYCLWGYKFTYKGKQYGEIFTATHSITIDMNMNRYLKQRAMIHSKRTLKQLKELK